MEDSHSQYLQVIRTWAAMVWADGAVTTNEASAMRRLIGGSELNEAEKQIALGFLDKKVELETGNLDTLGGDAREGIYRAAVKLAAIDNEISEEEIDFLPRLRKALRIDDATAERIEDTVAAGK
jgi:uncharacterized membrane protein YebE (DUF533 family)